MVRGPHDSADFTTCTEQVRSLAFQHVEVLLFSDFCFSEKGQLKQLTFSHLPSHSCQDVENGQRSFRQTRFKCRHVKPIAHEHGRFITVERIYGGSTSTGFRMVDDIVVYKSGCVKKLHYRSHSYRLIPRALAADGVVRKNRQRRSNAFAAGRTQVFTKVIDHLDI